MMDASTTNNDNMILVFVPKTVPQLPNNDGKDNLFNFQQIEIDSWTSDKNSQVHWTQNLDLTFPH